MVFVESLWGDEFTLTNDYDKLKEIIKKVNNPKSIESMSPDKVLKSKTIPFEEKLKVTEEEVNRTLGKYSEIVTCIYTREGFKEYIDKAIENGIISIDTETLGTRTDIEKPATDPFTCKIAGLCLYTPDMKSAYIPVNHINYKTGERWPNQITEEDIKKELSRVVDNDVFTVFHNGKFDHMVLYYTCGVKVPIYWDTMIFSQLANENERAGLKYQYTSKIDPEQEKYDIDKLFDLDMLGYYPTELFKLYAAQDPYMTYKLYEYQRELAYDTEIIEISDNNGILTFKDVDFIPTDSGEKYIADLKIGDKIKLINGSFATIKSININRLLYSIQVI